MTLLDLSLYAIALLSMVAVIRVLLGWLLPRHRPPAARRAPPDPVLLDRLRQQTEGWARRGRIAAITTAATLPDERLTPLGEVWLTRGDDSDARDALAHKAVRLFPAARVLTQLTQTPRTGGTEWRATACAAQPLPQTGTVAPVLVDGSNVVMWEVNAGLAQRPTLATLAQVLDLIVAEGRAATIVFDATIGHKLAGRYLSAAQLSAQLGHRAHVSVHVVGKGEIADATLIAMARDSGAEIVTNDLYRDHARPATVRLRPGFSAGGHVELPPVIG